MKKIVLIYISLICIALTSFGFDDVRIKPMKTLKVVSLDTNGGFDTVLTYDKEFLNDILLDKYDSLLNSWYVKNVLLPDTTLTIVLDENAKDVSDSIYIERLQGLDSYVDLSFNKLVKNYIELYMKRRPSQVSIMLGLSKYYFPIFEAALDKYGLPLELKYMPIIESALNPTAYSRAGACGIWQFVYGTGKMYDLEITSYIDERRDPVKSSEAAAKYLKDLYDIYQNWHLVIAAYNCGPGNVNKAIRRSGGKRDYWTVYYRLPRETRGYVPNFIAAAYAMNYYEKHGIKAAYPTIELATDTIIVNDYLHFKQVEAFTGVDMAELRALNPQYRRDIIPAKGEKQYPLRLPVDAIGLFIENEMKIFAHKREEYFPNNEIKNPKSRYHYEPVDIAGKDKVYYKVKSGDNIGFISEWFNVRSSDLRYWNNISRNLIRVGQRMVIYVPKGKGDYYNDFDHMSFAQKQAAIGKSSKPKEKTEPAPLDPNYEYYTVRSGDNLWEIAQKFPGISSSDIMKLNGISNSKSLSIGQKLKIKRKG